MDCQGNWDFQKIWFGYRFGVHRRQQRGIQALLAGDLGFTEAVGTSAINGKMAGGNIAIINGVVNTLPYYIIGNPPIKSRDDLKGRTAAVHIPGTAADFALRLGHRSAAQ